MKKLTFGVIRSFKLGFASFVGSSIPIFAVLCVPRRSRWLSTCTLLWPAGRIRTRAWDWVEATAFLFR